MHAVARLDDLQRCLRAPANLWASVPKKEDRLAGFTILNTNPALVRDTIDVFRWWRKEKPTADINSSGVWTGYPISIYKHLIFFLSRMALAIYECWDLMSSPSASLIPKSTTFIFCFWLSNFACDSITMHTVAHAWECCVPLTSAACTSPEDVSLPIKPIQCFHSSSTLFNLLYWDLVFICCFRHWCQDIWWGIGMGCLGWCWSYQPWRYSRNV